MSPVDITSEIAKALGVSKARKAVLTLEVGELPRLEVETYLTGADDTVVIELDPETLGPRIAMVAFKLRLEPFSDD